MEKGSLTRVSFDPRNFKHVVVSLAAASSQSVDPLFRFYCQGYFAHESSSSFRLSKGFSFKSRKKKIHHVYKSMHFISWILGLRASPSPIRESILEWLRNFCQKVNKKWRTLTLNSHSSFKWDKYKKNNQLLGTQEVSIVMNHDTKLLILSFTLGWTVMTQNPLKRTWHCMLENLTSK